MAESMKPPQSGPTNGDVRSLSSRTNNIPTPKYLLPIPFRTFPLPTFYPSNPVSLLHLAIAWVRQIVYPPAVEPSIVHEGVWSPETRSVHVTDPTSMSDLWCQGFFGKGSLSRSEPSWLQRQLGETSEQRTAKRREERASTKWERGRSELEALERKRYEEEAAATAALALQRQKEQPTVLKQEEETPTIPSHADKSIPKESLGSTFKAPVGPLELLALPNSQADLVQALLVKAGNEDPSNECVARPLFRPPVGPLELLTLPNSAADYLKAFPPKAKLSRPHPAATESCEPFQSCSQQPYQNGRSSLNGTPANGTGASVNGASIEPISQEQKEEGCNGNAIDGELSDTLTLKRQKMVRFAANVESTTFQCSDPPSPNHIPSATSAKQVSSGQAMNGNSGAPADNGVAKCTAPSPTEQSPRDADKKKSEALTKGTELPMANKEHLQLSAEEAFFLAYGLGALVVTDPETKKPLTTTELFSLCRQFSYFPPRTPNALSTDDPFLVHYAVYHHFRSLGWVPRHGIKFGVDWLLYGKGPALDHAEFGVIVMPSYSDAWWKANGREAPRKSWHWLHSVNRVLSTVFKSLVLVYVDVPPPSAVGDSASDLLQRFQIREVMVRRWSSNRNRD